MRSIQVMRIIKKAIPFIVLLNLTIVSFPQNTDSTKIVSFFSGAVTLTNNGVSTIPNLTLGKPAAMFALSMGRKFRFEPELRFALEGKPWTFIFWGRYELLNTSKFLIRTGVNYSINFKTISATTDEFSDEILWARRSLTGDLSAAYFLTKNISIGPYYMYIHGFEKNTTLNTHLVALRSNFSNIKLSDQFFIRFNPQVYFLKMDEYDGFYLNATITLARRNFPLSVSSLINKTIQTEIPVGEDFFWNLSLIYTFNNRFTKIQ